MKGVAAALSLAALPVALSVGVGASGSAPPAGGRAAVPRAAPAGLPDETAKDPPAGRSPDKVRTLLMFEGRAEEAVTFYVSLFDDARVESISRYGPEGPGPEGSVELASFSIDGREILCVDSFVDHDFTFTPAISLFVTCGSEEEIDELFARLSEGGDVHMPLDAYPFSRRFAWVVDRFGVSWQLSLP